MSITFTTVPAKTLYQPLLSTDVTFKLADITGFSGSNLTAADFGTVGYGVLLNSDRSVMELFSWDPTTIASTSISFVARGLPFTGSGASVTAYKLDWPAGSTVLIGSDTPQFIQWLKDYIDGIAIAGSPDASTTTKGIVEEATQAEVDAGTAAGSTSARLFINPSTHRARLFNDYAVDASGTDAYTITPVPTITAYATGQRFTFKAGTANTGACTLNVSGLGAKTIKKDVSSDLATGDILANQIVEVEYDGTNMQLLSKTPQGSVSLTSQVTGVLPVANGGTGLVTLNYNSVAQAGAVSSTTVIAHGLGKTPAHIKIHCFSSVGFGTMGTINSVGTYNGTTNQCIYNNETTGGSGQIIGSSDTSNIIYLQTGSGATYTKGVATMDATNVTITWTSFNGGIANVLLLEAWGI